MNPTVSVTTRTGKYVHAAVRGHSTTLCGKSTTRSYEVPDRITCTICYARAEKDARYLAQREEWVALDACPFCAPDEPCALHLDADPYNAELDEGDRRFHLDR